METTGAACFGSLVTLFSASGALSPLYSVVVLAMVSSVLSAVQEFVIGSERTYYREDDISEMNDVLCEHYDPELVDNMTEEETRAAYNALPWKKAIFVDVHQYEEEPDAEI